MLSATKSQRFSLADVLTSCLSAVRGEANALELGGVKRAVVVLADGLGAHALKASAGHARTLAPMLSKATTASVGFPTTTASSLASLTTGTHPGEHGLVGYRVLDVERDRVFNQLTEWDGPIDPAVWQRCRTVFEIAGDAKIPSFCVGVERYRNTGFTQAVLRGAEFRAAGTIDQRLDEARRILDEHERALIYVYVPELDQAGHSHGWQSRAWTDRLEELDSAARGFGSSLSAEEGMVLTADHGVIDVASHHHIILDDRSGLLDGVRHLAGEPRCLQLHLEPDASEGQRRDILRRWVDSESGRSWVVSRAEAVATGWFGPQVAPEVLPRIGDILVAARKSIAYYDGRVATDSGRTMVGQHGSLTPDEVLVPLLRFGAFG
jgi:predicted AlkP superfamily pyrophosphatase or phosphodiesterase